jgi:hypothetical protein
MSERRDLFVCDECPAVLAIADGSVILEAPTCAGSPALGTTHGRRQMRAVTALIEAAPIDPRELGGAVSGPGGPFDEGQVIVDTSRAILQDHLEVVKIDNPSDGREIVAVLISGRINRSIERADVMVMGDLDMLAAFITQAHGLAERMGRQDELHDLCRRRWAEMPTGADRG